MLTAIGTVSAWTLANANWIGIILFAATAVGLILMGTTPAKRAGGCLVQTCIVVAVLRANLPPDRRTDLGQFVDAMNRNHGERLAAIIDRKQKEKNDAVQFASNR